MCLAEFSREVEEAPVDPPPDSDQLSLGLLWSEPWDGWAPRALTRGRKALFLRQKPPRHEVFFDPEQLELWPIQGHTERGAP